MKTISEMTDEELNNAVAVEVMGWYEQYDALAWEWAYWSTEKDAEVAENTDFDFYLNEWNPCEDIRQAWQVVEKMRSMGWSYVVGDEAGIYYCKFINLYITCSDEANTQQRAICQAALDAVRNKKG